MMSNLSASALQPQSVTILSGGAGQTQAAAKDKKGFGFGDFLDMINPLHHIPVVGQVYRAVTGDQISDKARLAGGGLFAGPLGIGIAAGTIAMRKNDAPEPSAPPQTPQTTVTVPIAQHMQGYQALSAKHWTPQTLSALATSINADLGTDRATQNGQDEEEPPAPVRAPVGDVQSQSLPPANAHIMAQMLSNLEKYEALASGER